MKKLKSSHQSRIKDNIYNILIFICIIVFIIISMTIFFLFFESEQNEEVVEEVKELIVEVEDNDKETHDRDLNTLESPKFDYYIIDDVPVQKKFKNIYIKNKDFIGWITIDDTEIDYPVVQTLDDEEYYLRRDFEGNYNIAGTLFLDRQSSYKLPSDNMIMYGHHMHDGTMFKELLKYEDEDYYKEHKYITFDTINGNATYEVIAAYRTQIYSEDSNEFKYYEFHNALSAEDFNDFIDNSKKLTPYTIDCSAKIGDKLLTLSTCAYHTTNGRYVVIAKRIGHIEIDTINIKPLETIHTEQN